MIAVIHVRKPSGAVAVFYAHGVRLDHGLVTASGRWKNCPDDPAREYTWPASRLLQIRKEAS